jgi:hypothetical protein
LGFDVEVVTNDDVDLSIDFIALTCAAIHAAVHGAFVGFCPATSELVCTTSFG